MPPPIPTRAQFEQDTGHRGKNPFKSRGRIKRIDVALDQWTDVKHTGDNDMKVAALWLLYKECRKWVEAKDEEIRGGKIGNSTLSRRNQVQTLRALVGEWIDALVPELRFSRTQSRYETRKLRGAHGTSRGLQGVYVHERNVYMKLGKSRAPSVSDLEGDYEYEGHKQRREFRGKEFNTFSESDFRKLDRITGSKVNVLYLKRRERLKYMVFVADGKLCDADDNPIDTPVGFSRMYAMDRFCNLYVQTNELQDYMISQKKTRGRGNHSSLVSGRDVLCAGTITIVGGVLKMISNNSGHYKPTRRQLFEAVQVLLNDGVDLSEAIVDCREPKRFDPDRGRLTSIEYRAADFAQDIEPFFNLGVMFVE